MIALKKVLSTTPETISTSTPTLESINSPTTDTIQKAKKPKTGNKEILMLIIHKKSKIMSRHKGKYRSLH